MTNHLSCVHRPACRVSGDLRLKELTCWCCFLGDGHIFYFLLHIFSFFSLSLEQKNRRFWRKITSLDLVVIFCKHVDLNFGFLKIYILSFKVPHFCAALQLQSSTNRKDKNLNLSPKVWKWTNSITHSVNFRCPEHLPPLLLVY